MRRVVLDDLLQISYRTGVPIVVAVSGGREVRHTVTIRGVRYDLDEPDDRAALVAMADGQAV